MADAPRCGTSGRLDEIIPTSSWAAGAVIALYFLWPQCDEKTGTPKTDFATYVIDARYQPFNGFLNSNRTPVGLCFNPSTVMASHQFRRLGGCELRL